MRTILKVSMTGLMAIALGLLVTPNAQSGSGCGSSSNSGSSSGCGSNSEIITAEAQEMPEVDQDIARMEELADRLSGNIADLEDRLAEIITAIEDDRLRRDLESAKRILGTLQRDMTNYQFLSAKTLASLGQVSMAGGENPVSTTDAHKGHSY